MRSGRFVLLSLALGCSSTSGSPADDTGSTGSDPSTSTDPQPGSTSVEVTSGTSSESSGDSTTSDIAWETEGADEGYGTTGDCGFTCPQPPGGSGGGPLECSFTDQDCGEGETCMPWDNSGGRTWNALRCVPLDGDPVGLGEPCQAEGSFLSGIDDCEAGLWCGPDAAEGQRTLQGTCKQLCNAGPCPEGTTCVVPGAVFVGVCEPLCDPLAPDACPAGQACMPAGFAFACHVAAYESVESDCVAHSQCAPGSACLGAAQCEGDSCCADLCDLSEPVCPSGQTCIDQGSPLPAYENVGYCSAQ